MDYFLSDTAKRLQSISTGNEDNKNGDRDHSLRKKEYWETRFSPRYPHHWTAAEFEGFIRLQKYPPNTFRDRIARHEEEVMIALIRGEWVPAEVMQDSVGRNALDLAQMHVKAQDSCARASYFQRANAASFSRALLAGGADLREALIISAAKELAAGFGEAKRALQVAGYEGSVWPVSVGERGAKSLDFVDARYPREALFGRVGSVSHGDLNSILNKAVLKGDIAYDEVTWLMGGKWAPATVFASDRPRN